MKRIYRYGLAMLAASVLYACSVEDESLNLNKVEDLDLVGISSSLIEGKYIVVFNTEKTGKASSRVGNDYQLTSDYVREQATSLLFSKSISTEAINEVYSQAIDGFAVYLSVEELEELQKDERVKYIEQDRVIALAPPPGKGPGGGGGGSTGQETPYGITRVGGAVNYSGSNVAWVIDTGIDLTHPDLNVSTTNGFTAFTSGKDANLNDGNGHGSHVAGTIAAINNDIGVVGVAAGAPVVPVKVLDSRGSGSYSGVIAGVDWVASKGKSGDVANMSLGGPVSQALDDAVKAAASKGIKFVIAAGNDGRDANNYSPARVNGTNIFTISAMNSSDTFASWSNWGNPPVDYCAPGVSIKSTWKGGGYNTISGTSMAAPHAAGVLLLGNARTSGFVKSDPDGNADPIISR